MNYPITIYVSNLYKNIKKQEKYFFFIINCLRIIYPKKLIKLYSTLLCTYLEISITKFAYVSKILPGFDSSNQSKETLDFIKTHIKLHNTFNEYQMIINNLNNKYKKFISRHYILENDNSKNRNISGSFILNYELLDKMRDILLFKNKKLNSFIKYKIGKSY